MSVEPILVEKTWPANELESKKTKDLVDGVEAAAATSALTLSNELKNRGNELFKAHRYAESRDAYTHALNVLCNAAEVSGFCDGSEGLTIPQDMLTAFKAKPELRDDWPTHIDTAQVEEIRFQLMPSLLCNLCAAEIWLETYGAAFQYASWALDVSNNKFAKAYYRRAAAAVYLNQLKNAISDYEKVLEVLPHDESAKSKLNETRKLYTQMRFAAAIAGEDRVKPSSKIDMSEWEVPPNYTGIRYARGESSKWTAKEFQGMLDFLRNPENRLDKAVILHIVLDVIAYHQTLPNVVDVAVPEDGKINVCGDVHGQFYDLLSIFERHGMPSEKNLYLFNGDFVDRGSFSLEVISSLYMARLIWPNAFFMTRGNHESADMTANYGFQGEVKAKTGQSLYPLFLESFENMPLAHVISKRVFVVHGGLSSQPNVTIEQINKIDRTQPASSIMEDLLWADPQDEPGSAPSKRGTSRTFGPDITDNFLAANPGLEMVVRSHEMKDAGYEIQHSGKLVTIFSAPNYCDQMGNRGAVMTFSGADLRNRSVKVNPKYTQFDAQPHPPVRALQYASSLLGWGGR